MFLTNLFIQVYTKSWIYSSVALIGSQSVDVLIKTFFIIIKFILEFSVSTELSLK